MNNKLELTPPNDPKLSDRRSGQTACAEGRAKAAGWLSRMYDRVACSLERMVRRIRSNSGQLKKVERSNPNDSQYLYLTTVQGEKFAVGCLLAPDGNDHPLAVSGTRGCNERSQKAAHHQEILSQ